MAKVKVKLDVAAIKKWLLEHGEKLALGITALVFLTYTWSAVSREVYSKQPAELLAEAAKVTTHVKSSPWNNEQKTKDGIEIARFDVLAKRDEVSPDRFKLPVPFDSPLADPKSQRGKPEIFPIEELKVAAGFGTFALRPEGAAAGDASRAGGNQAREGSKLTGLAWVAITGLVPADEQAQEYSKVFDRAMGGDSAKDVPKYLGFKVERAEVTDGPLEWKAIAPAAMSKFELGPEVVRPEFVDARLTLGLPLIGSGWGDAVTHPKIPLADPGNTQANAPPPPAPVEEKKADDGKGADDGFSGSSSAATPTVTTAPPPAAAKPDEPARGYRLFRGFDFTVEPNKKYRYRVVIRLQNPNAGILPQYLQDPALAAVQHLDTAPTEPSEPIAVPDGNQVLGGPVKIVAKEPQGELMLISVLKDVGMEAAYQLMVQRGTLANTVHDAEAKDRLHGKTEEMSDVHFQTDAVVLDLHGGRSVSLKGGSKFFAPAEILLVDRNGDLMVRRELDDESMFAERKPKEKEEEDDEKKPPPPPKVVKPKRVNVNR